MAPQTGWKESYAGSALDVFFNMLQRNGCILYPSIYIYIYIYTYICIYIYIRVYIYIYICIVILEKSDRIWTCQQTALKLEQFMTIPSSTSGWSCIADESSILRPKKVRFAMAQLNHQDCRCLSSPRFDWVRLCWESSVLERIEQCDLNPGWLMITGDSTTLYILGITRINRRIRLE